MLGGLAGFLAMRFMKSGSPPTPVMAIEEAQLIKADGRDLAARQADRRRRIRRALGAARRGGGQALMAATRTPEEIKRSIEANRAELGLAVERLRGEVAEIADWRKHLRNNQKQVLIGAAVAGFVLGGGIGALTGLVSGRRRRREYY